MTEEIQRWNPSLGAIVQPDGVLFKVWAPEARLIEIVIEGSAQRRTQPLSKLPDGTWSVFLPGVQPGALYRYWIDGDRCLPDPASRFQPQGVHGPSQVIDPHAFTWSDGQWNGIVTEEMIFYELHTGTFTPEGTFCGAIERLPYLADLGITAVELMPLGDFPGKWNWGYDGVDLFAPARCYGSPDDLRTLVNAAHQLGLAIFVDTVYNHFGPDGAYAPSFSRFYFSDRHKTPWGDAINLDGAHASFVRNFFIENVLYWVHEFHMDGIRLDATHAMIDDSPQHFVAELSAHLQASAATRNVRLIAEDHRNMAHIVKLEREGGWGLDAVWSDDFHHEIHVLLSREQEGYYSDFKGTTTDLAETLNKGWFFCGQHSTYFDTARGSDPSGLAPRQFVFFLQNHDQVGNRAFGERLHFNIDLADYRAASVLLLCAPQTPLLFMGQEWAATSPFLYFTDHNNELGSLVTEGRRNEFARFSAFSDPNSLEKIPDPQNKSAFEKSRLIWSENHEEPHAGILHLYQRLIWLRKSEPALNPKTSGRHKAVPLSKHALLLRSDAQNSTILVILQFRELGTLELPELTSKNRQVLLTTEDSRFTLDPSPITIEAGPDCTFFHFSRPGAVIVKINKP